MAVVIRAEYLGKADAGVRVHSKFLAGCDSLAVFERFKKDAVSRDTAEFFIDLFDQDKSEIIETIGISESVYSRVTKESVMSYDFYLREADFNEDLLFGAIEEQLRSSGVKLPWSSKESFGISAKKLHEFRQSDHAMIEMNVDSLGH